MAQNINSTKEGLRTAYVSTVIGIVMVLFITGLVSWFVLGLNHLKNNKIESFEIDLFFEKSVSDVELGVIEQEIAAKHYVSSASYRSSEEAWEILSEEVGDSALTVIDNENPLNQSIIMTLKKDYFSLDSLTWIETELKAEYPEQLTEVSYRKEDFQEVNTSLQKMVYFVLLIALMLLFIAIGMINNTIRLSLYSKRFLIKTMQLVGATPGFIRRPFILSAIGQALISGLIAGCMVLGFLFLLERYDPIFLDMTDIRIFLIVMVGIVLLGIIITVLSTYFALRKYLRLNLDNLY
jgi:cell division transport system permease protein